MRLLWHIYLLIKSVGIDPPPAARRLYLPLWPVGHGSRLGEGREVQRDNGKRRHWQNGKEALCPILSVSLATRPQIKPVNKCGGSCSVLNDGDLRLFVVPPPPSPRILFCMMALLTRYKWGDTCTPSIAWPDSKDNFQVLVLYILCSSIA